MRFSTSARVGALVATAIAITFASVPGSGVAAADDAGDDPVFSWEMLDSGTDNVLVGVDLVSPDIAWVGAWGPEIFRTVDGGATFTKVAPSDAVELGMELTDVEAFSAQVAIAIAWVPDAPPRIYRTADGGATWTETFRADTSSSFYNCIAMFDRRRGFILGDPVNGEFEILVTGDGGRTWDLAPGAGIPDPIEGEAGATFGGECASATQKTGFFGTGFAAESRVFRSYDYGWTWEVLSTGTPDLLNAIEFRTNRLGVATGVPLLRSTDGGLSWERADALEGFRSDVAWWADKRGDQLLAISGAQKTVFAIGPDGSDVSRDRGRTFERFDDGAFHSIDCLKGTTTCWASGPDGRIARLVVS